MANRFPKTMKAGRFRGQTFSSQGEYDAALRGDAFTDHTPSSNGAAKTTRAKPRYVKQMVEAVVQLIEGVGTIVIPKLRDHPLTDEERGWLCEDWYQFGKSNPWFANLLVNLFGIDVYGKIATDMIVVVGRRVVVDSPNPRIQALALPVNMAYILRKAMDAEIVDLPDTNGNDVDTLAFDPITNLNGLGESPEDVAVPYMGTD